MLDRDFDRDVFVRGFLVALLFSEPVYFDKKFDNIPNLEIVDEQSYCLDNAMDVFLIKDFSQESRERMGSLCSQFLQAAEKYIPLFEGYEEQAGIDFYLTLVGHGAGFWDDSRKYEGKGKEITDVIHNTFGYKDISLYSPDGRTLIAE